MVPLSPPALAQAVHELRSRMSTLEARVALLVRNLEAQQTTHAAEGEASHGDTAPATAAPAPPSPAAERKPAMRPSPPSSRPGRSSRPPEPAQDGPTAPPELETETLTDQTESLV